MIEETMLEKVFESNIGEISLALEDLDDSLGFQYVDEISKIAILAELKENAQKFLSVRAVFSKDFNEETLKSLLLSTTLIRSSFISTIWMDKDLSSDDRRWIICSLLDN